ncbi:MAG TPA: ABC transporter substrate-binding protein [Actinomycetota bacterium]|nr:ABC transporter substrate-binding protein [Actinomycetota bacterium]
MLGRWRSLALAVVFVWFVASCTGDGQRAGTNTGPSPEQWRGGTLRVAVGADPSVWWDPAGYTAASPWGLYHCCLLRTLMSYSGRPAVEGGVELRPDLAAEAPVVSEDGLTWTFRLREGLRFAPPFDDVEIVAADIVRALERLGTPSSLPPDEFGGSYSFYFSVIDGFDAFLAGEAGSIRGLETPDRHTLVVRLTEPTGDLPDRFSMPATAPVPEGVRTDRQLGYVRYLVASGPYMFEGSGAMDFSLPPKEQEPVAGFEPMRSIVLVRNPSWNPATDALRAAYVDRIEFEPFSIPSGFVGGMAERREIASAIASRMAAGDLDLNTANLYATLMEAYERDPELRARLTTTTSPVTYYLPMNLAVPPLDDVHVRRAIGLAIDRKWLLRAFESGDRMGGIAWHLAPDVTGRGLLAQFRPSWMSESGGDLEAARAEMRKSSYDQDGDGVCDDPVCRGVRSIDLEGQSILPMLRRDLKAIGIAFANERVPDEEGMWERLWVDALSPAERFGTVLVKWWAWGYDYPNGSTVFMPLTHSGAAGYANFFSLGASADQLRDWGYDVTSVPSVDDRIERCLSLPSADQPACWAELDAYLMTEVVPAVPLFFDVWRESTSARVEHYSWDPAFSYPALDQVSLVPGSE